jgi:hypothetical protein
MSVFEDGITDALARFAEAPPELIEARALQQRVDRKYLLPKRMLAPVLESLAADYLVARARDVLVARYETVYFDTPERRLFEDHRRGRRPRYKIRLRHHCDRRLTFVEVKQKGGWTSKMRLELPFSGGQTPATSLTTTELSADARRFIDEHCPIGAAGLVPRIWVTFSRVTLVGEAINERATFDWNIEYGDGEKYERIPELVVGEVKQARYANGGPAVRALRRLHIREQTLSKYCLATVRLASVRANAFNPCLRMVERMTA